MPCFHVNHYQKYACPMCNWHHPDSRILLKPFSRSLKQICCYVYVGVQEHDRVLLSLTDNSTNTMGNADLHYRFLLPNYHAMPYKNSRHALNWVYQPPQNNKGNKLNCFSLDRYWHSLYPPQRLFASPTITRDPWGSRQRKRAEQPRSPGPQDVHSTIWWFLNVWRVARGWSCCIKLRYIPDIFQICTINLLLI